MIIPAAECQLCAVINIRRVFFSEHAAVVIISQARIYQLDTLKRFLHAILFAHSASYAVSM